MNPITLLSAYGFDQQSLVVSPLGHGLINTTWRVESGNNAFVFQKINQNVFKHPQDIADNLDLLANYLAKAHPQYLFTAPLRTRSGASLVRDSSNEYYRLFPFIKDSHTITAVTDPHAAFEAALQFGLFTARLNEFDCYTLKTTIPQFHDLHFRFKQFQQAVEQQSAKRNHVCKKEIDYLLDQHKLVETFDWIKDSHFIKRVTHHDTKISNILYDKDNKGLCVIDLDTTMPGFFISDVGDMFRTYLSASTEEETDFDRIDVRPEVFEAIAAGYLEPMRSLLSPLEKEHFLYAGYFMIYMQALRFLADYLNGDIYYQIQYVEQNLNRARNQIRLMRSFEEHENDFKKLLKRHF